MKKLIETLKNIWKIEDLRMRLLITVNLRTWNHAIHHCFHLDATSRSRCALFPEDAARG